jgi:hypothetical protein
MEVDRPNQRLPPAGHGRTAGVSSGIPRARDIK